jgi:hypothetical protein
MEMHVILTVKWELMSWPTNALNPNACSKIVMLPCRVFVLLVPLPPSEALR